MDKVDSLIIVGNGFDRWQGLSTSYIDFQNYYLKNRDKIMRELGLEKNVYTVDGYTFTDVELIYGDAFDLSLLSSEFWYNFEENLANVDEWKLSVYFGKEKGELKELLRAITNAKSILRKAFCRWVSSINTEKPTYKPIFSNNSAFINFNYTDTLTRNFNVCKEKIFHIHGYYKNPKSIVFGHSSNPHKPYSILKKWGGRFESSYYIQNLLYQTDKKVNINKIKLSKFLAKKRVVFKDVKSVYVLGHSFSSVDFAYFEYLLTETRQSATWKVSYHTQDDLERIQGFFKRKNFKNYELYSSIDGCLQN